jgi:hypothetical protein
VPTFYTKFLAFLYSLPLFFSRMSPASGLFFSRGSQMGTKLLKVVCEEHGIGGGG